MQCFVIYAFYRHYEFVFFLLWLFFFFVLLVLLVLYIEYPEKTIRNIALLSNQRFQSKYINLLFILNVYVCNMLRYAIFIRFIEVECKVLIMRAFFQLIHAILHIEFIFLSQYVVSPLPKVSC